PARIGVPRIGQFLVPREVIVGDADLAVHLPAVGAFEINPVVTVTVHGVADHRVGHLLVGDLLDVKRFLVADRKLRTDLIDHVVYGYFSRRRAVALLARAGAEFHFAAGIP